MRLIRSKYLALLRGPGASFWRVEYSADEAIKGVCQEFHKAFPEAKERVFDRIYVYTIPTGQYAYWDDHGTFLVNELTDVVVGMAECAFAYEGVSSKRPLTTSRLNTQEVRRINERVAKANHMELDPIGKKVPA